MQVSDIMTPKVITINETQSLLEVRELMANNNLRRVPVVNDIGVLKGIITDGDIRRAFDNDQDIRQITAADIMNRSPKTIKPNVRFADAEVAMRTAKLSALVVMDDERKVVGVLQIFDISQNETST